MLDASPLTRARLQARIQQALARSRAVVLVGPRQSGKTTLARSFVAADHPNYFDLEHPLQRDRLAEPLTTLAPLRGLVVIDEVQRAPDLFPVLRVLLDRTPLPAQFLLLGSASPGLLTRSGESLLGRIEVIEVTGFDLDEVQAMGPGAGQRLWLRGGYPRSFLAATDADSMQWRLQAIQRHVEADLPQLDFKLPAPAMLRFWRMLAHLHGQVWNAAEPARSLGVSEPTVRRWLDALVQTGMLRSLPPWHENLGKRLVKSPKIYFRDCGLLHAMLGIGSFDALLAHPRCGASWEGHALEQVLRLAEADDAAFWSTHQGAELDLLLLRGDERVGVEFKRADSPTVTRSMRIAMQDLKLTRLFVVHPGPERFALDNSIEAVPLEALLA